MAGPAVYGKLATRIREIAVEAQLEDGSGAERFKVVQLAPLRIEQVGGEVVLEDGDPDFTIGGVIRDRLALATLALGDEVWCLREGSEWHLVDVVSEAAAGGPDLTVAGSLTVDGTAHLEGAATLDSTLNVLGTTELHGAVTLDSTLSVVGSGVFGGSGRFSGNLRVGGTATAAFSLDATGDVNVTGVYRVGGVQISAGNLSNGTTGTGAVVLAGSPTISGVLTVGTVNASGYQVSGVALAASHLSNGTTGSGAVVLAGSPTLTGTVSVTGASASYFFVDRTDGVTSWALYADGSGVSSKARLWRGSDLLTMDGSGNLSVTGQYRVGGVQIAAANLSNGTTGSGSVVLAASPTLSGTVGGALGFSGAHTHTADVTLDAGAGTVASPLLHLTGRNAGVANDATIQAGALGSMNFAIISAALFQFKVGTVTNTIGATGINIAPGTTYQVNGAQISASNLSNGVTGSGAVTLATGPALTGTPTAPSAAVDTSTTQLATTAFVIGQAASATPLIDGTAAVGTSTRYARADHVHPTDTTRAALASPTFTGTPAAPTATAGTNTTQIATTAFVQAATSALTTGVASVFGRTGAVVAVSGDYAVGQVTGAAPLASPTLTGVPAAPTAAVDTSTTQLASTAFVIGQASAAGDGTPAMDGTAARGTSTHFARADHVHPTDTSRAPLASPGLTGTPTAPTALAGTNTTQLATTAFVTTAIAAGPVSSVFGRTGAVVAASGDYSVGQVTGAAPLASPALTGTPTAPTAAVDTNTTQLASTAFVLGQAASATPLMDGTAAVGTSTRYARADHVHATDTSRAPTASPTFTGTITSPNITGIGSTAHFGIFNADTSFQLGGVNINTAGTLGNVGYLNQAQTWTGGATGTPGNVFNNQAKFAKVLAADYAILLDAGSGNTGLELIGYSGATAFTHAISTAASALNINAFTTMHFQIFGTTQLTLSTGSVNVNSSMTIDDGISVSVGTTTGTIIGSTTGQKLGFWNTTPVTQRTTANVTASGFTANTGTAVNNASTFGGYTLQQVVGALRQIGILA